MNRNERSKIAQQNLRLIKRYENKYLPKVEKALKTDVSSFINAIKRCEGRMFLQNNFTNPNVVEAVTEMYKEVATVFYKRTKKAIERKGYLQDIISYLAEHILDKLTFKITETLTNHLRLMLDRAVAQGLGVDETVRLIDNDEFTRFQAARIVRTEVNRAVNIATKKAGDDSDFEMVKEWIAVKDARTRGNPVHGRKDQADHWNLDGQVVDVGQKFYDSRSGAYLDQPGDPNAPASDTINCRCQIAVYAKRDANGRMIPKKSKIYIDRNFNQNRQIVTI